ncbi:hypothetical protein VN97_g2148 [Penicillium thymicola]|uniref:Uncharacterized protein n=1 Tax=Penicillium thymicola TaxID=293382 RepID=A0AAI9XC00_PENTH|nr:hypothetical protein VN97_g2148 [Penicillium thymicola]
MGPRAKREEAKLEWWDKAPSMLSRWYNSWGGHDFYAIKDLPELSLYRPVLHRWLASYQILSRRFFLVPRTLQTRRRQARLLLREGEEPRTHCALPLSPTTPPSLAASPYLPP